MHAPAHPVGRRLDGDWGLVFGMTPRECTDLRFDEARLIGFKCGNCYDIDRGVMRPVAPRDMLTRHTGYPYKPYCEREDAELEGYLKEILPDDDVRQYRWSLLRGPGRAPHMRPASSGGRESGAVVVG